MKYWLRILSGFGKITALFGALAALPAVVSWRYEDGWGWAYLAAAAGAVAFGALAHFVGKMFRGELLVRHAFLLIVLIWSALPLFGAIPLYLILNSEGQSGLTFTRAYFEAASGLTATGATVLTNLDSLPPSLNFWRCEMSWIGGMGLVVLATAVLPVLGVGGRQMFQTELPGPFKDTKLTPNIADTAKVLWLTYTALTAACAVAYALAGMKGLDPLLHAFTTLALGGFSSHDASFAYFNSPAIEAVAVVFMIIAGMNFATHTIALNRLSPRVYMADMECRYYLALLAAGVAAVFLFLLSQEVYDDWRQTLRHAVFNTVSIATTTGYSSDNYGAWPLFAPLLMLALANCTACGGSTGGGMKLVRSIIAMRQTFVERTKLVHPHAHYDLKMASRALPNKTVISVLYFILAYLLSALFLMLLLVATGMDLTTAMGAAAASISNTGPGLGDVGPAGNYGQLSTAQTWLCAGAMLIGRIEILAFLIVFSRQFWRY